MGQYTEALQKLYVAYFNRPADRAGLAYWDGILTDKQASLHAISETFATSPEYQITYVGLSNAQVINQVYVNLFGRNAEAEGLQYWVNLLDSKQINLANVVTSVGNGALNSDAIAYAAKTAAATDFTDGMRTATDVLSYETLEAKVIARNFIASVMDGPSLAEARSTLQETIQSMSIKDPYPIGVTLFSKGVDTLLGTDKTDFFLARSDGTSLTLNAGDAVDGGAGQDTLFINIANHRSFSTPSNLSIHNIEQVNFVSKARADLNTTGWLGLHDLTVMARDTSNIVADSTSNITARIANASVVTVNGGNDVNLTVTELAVYDQILSSVPTAPPALRIGESQAPLGKVNILATTQVADSMRDHAAPINVHGGTEITIKQFDAGDQFTPFRPAGSVNVKGTAITTSVSSSVPSAIVSGAESLPLTITDVHAASNSKLGTISSVKLSGHRMSTIADNALTNLELSNLRGTVVVDNSGGYKGAASTLALSLNNADASVHDYGAYSKIDITLPAGEVVNRSSIHALGSAGLKSLTVSGSGIFALEDGFAPSKLESIVVSGNVEFTARDLNQLPQLSLVDLSASKAAGVVIIDSMQTSVIGSSADDSVSTLATAVNKAIDLGAGNDILYLNNVGKAPSAIINGDAGIDKLDMSWAEAATFFKDSAIRSQVLGFEVLQLSRAAQTQTLDLANGPDFSKITVLNTELDSQVNLLNLNHAATLALGGSTQGLVTVDGSKFAQGSADSLNVEATSYGAAELFLQVANVEQVNLQVIGIPRYVGHGRPPVEATMTMHLQSSHTQQLSLTGGAEMILDFTSTALQNLDASTFTGSKLQWAAGALQGNVNVAGSNNVNTIDLSKAVTANVTYKGGSAADTLTLAGGANTVSLGSGADVLIITAAGKDSATYTTVSDAHQGMKIVLPSLGTAHFTSTKLQVANAQTLTNYLDGAIASLGNAANNAANGWFQFQGDTYYVQSRHDGSSNAHFIGGTDLVVKLTGLLDLSQAQFAGNSLSF